jgi:hypothetical protein
VFDPPGSITLWKLPAEVEDRFEGEWSRWIDDAVQWKAFASDIQAPTSTDLLAEARRLELADDDIIHEARQLRRSAENRAVPIPGEHRPTDRVLALLALGFFRGEPGTPAIPYARLGG